MTQVQVGERTLSLSNLDKVLYPKAGFTKGQVIDYYARIAPIMLPHLAGRALTFKRFPNGVEKPGFWHKAVPSHAPEWITQWRYEDADEGETEWYFVADRPAIVHRDLRATGFRVQRGLDADGTGADDRDAGWG